MKKFEIEASDNNVCWAELRDRQIVIHRSPSTPHESLAPSTADEVLLQWDVDVLHNLLSWATQEEAVSTYFTGPMAHQIRKHSRELGMTPDMFVWHAVKVFIEVGAGT